MSGPNRSGIRIEAGTGVPSLVRTVPVRVLGSPWVIRVNRVIRVIRVITVIRVIRY